MRHCLVSTAFGHWGQQDFEIALHDQPDPDTGGGTLGAACAESNRGPNPILAQRIPAAQVHVVLTWHQVRELLRMIPLISPLGSREA